MPDIAVSVGRVSKDFILPHERVGKVKHLFTSLFDSRLTSRREVQRAVKSISFEVKKGEFFGIVGRNGSGKSTLLKMIAGIYQPTKGQVKVKGKLVPFIELGVGFNPELTGRENVFLNGALLGFSAREMRNMYDDIVQFAELEPFMDQKLKNYSSGMEVRLAFSLATRSDADILLVDEVLAVGDDAFKRKCFDYFKRLKTSHKTVIFVTHDMGAVQQYCDRAMLVDDGQIAEIGRPERIAMLYSKLFIKQQDADHLAVAPGRKRSVSGEERWGDGLAKWSRVRVVPGPLNARGEPEHVEVRASGQALKTIEFPIFGFSIKNSSFLQLTGTNTVRQSIRVSPLKKGQNFNLTWVVPNIFNTGTYYVDCTIAHDQASLVSDRWPDAASFNMVRLDDNPYTVAAGAAFTYGASKGVRS